METTMRTCVRFEISNQYKLIFDTETENIAYFVIRYGTLDIRTYNKTLISRKLADFNLATDIRHLMFDDVSNIDILQYNPPLRLMFDDGEPIFTLYGLPEAIEAREDIRHDYISRHIVIKDASDHMF